MNRQKNNEPLSLKDIANKIDQKTKVLKVEKTWFTFQGGESFFDTILEKEEINIRWSKDGDVALEADQVSIKGKADILNRESLPVNLIIRNKKNVPAMEITGTLPSDWYIGETFPWLNSAMLSGFHPDSTTFRMGVNNKPGVVEITCILSSPKAITLTLLITPNDKKASLFWQISSPLTLYGLSEAGVRNAEGTLQWSGENDFTGSLNAQLFIGSTAIPVRIPIPGRRNETVIELNAPKEGVTLPSLDGLSELIGSDLLSKAIEPIRSFIKQKELEVVGLEIGIANDRFEPSRINLLCQFNKDWSPVKGITLSKPSLFFGLERRIYGEPPVVTFEFRATMQVGNKEVDIGASLPDKIFFGRLKEGETLPMNDLVSSLGLNADIFPQMEVSRLMMSVNLQSSTLTVQATITGKKGAPWDIPLGTTTLFKKGATLNLSVGKSKTAGEIKGGVIISGLDIAVTCPFPGKPIFTGEIPAVKLTDILKDLLPKNFKIPKEIVDIDIKKGKVIIDTEGPAFKMDLDTDTEISFGDAGFLETKKIMVNWTKGKKKGSSTFKMEVTGKAKIAGLSFDVSFNVPGDLILKGSYAKLDLVKAFNKTLKFVSGGALSMPAGFLDLKLKDVDITFIPTKPALSLASAIDPYDAVELILSKVKGGKWAAGIGIKPGDKWKFSSIDKSLKTLDSIKLSNTALLVSSLEGSPLQFTRVTLPGAPIKLSKGLNFAATMTLKDTGLDQLLGIETLVILAAIGPDPKKLMLEGSVAGETKLAENVFISKIGVHVYPGGTSPEFSALCQVSAQVNKDELLFTGAISVMPNGATFAATMEGIWQNAFDAKGFDLADVAIELGISFQGIPSIGLTGRMQIGTIKGRAAVAFNSADPTQSMLAVDFNQLPLGELLAALCSSEVISNAKDLKKTLKDINLEEVVFQVVPASTRIGQILFEQGITIKGKLNVMNWEGSINATLDYASGLFIEGEMDSIKAGKLFSLTGAGRYKDPYIKLDLRIANPPAVSVAATASILGLKQGTLVGFSDQGFRFLIQGKIFDLFQAELDVNGEDLRQAGGFGIKASMKNDLISYLNKNVRAGIKKAADEATKELAAAQADIDKVQKEVNSLKNKIEKAKSTVRAERRRNQDALKKAKGELKKAQDQVKKLNDEIKKQREVVNKERVQTQKKLREAEKEVNKARDQVSSLNTQITAMRKKVRAEQDLNTRDIRAAEARVNAAQKDVNSLNSQIRKKKKDVKYYANKAKKEWYNPKWAAKLIAAKAEESALVAARESAKGALSLAQGFLSTLRKGVKIIPVDTDPRVAGLIAAKETANLGLQAANGVLKGIRKGIKTTPVDLDPRVAGPIALRETALKSLDLTQLSVDGAKAVIKITPIELDPRVAGLITLKETATGTLQAAKMSLEGVKVTIKEGAKAADFIARYGLGGVFDVKIARFEGELSVVDGGGVELEMDLKIMGKKEYAKLAFNFKDMTGSVARLVTYVLEK